MNIDAINFRRVMGRFATGVTIVTTKHNDEYHGLTVNSFTSLSLDPLLILINVSKKAFSHDLIRKARVFTVNFLAAEQERLSVVFADPAVTNRFEGVPVYEGVTGAPIIEGSMAYIEAEVERIYEGGDHCIFLGSPVAMRILNPGADPLLYYKGNYADIVAREEEDLVKQVPRV